jgi:hypothetical protein
VGSVKFKHGDLILVDSNIHHADCNIGYIIDPKNKGRTYNGVMLFGSDEIWWFRDEEMDILEPALTANEEQAKV